MKHKIFRKWREYSEQLLLFRSGIVTKFSAWFQDIQIDKGARFWGITKLVKEHGTSIRIGKNCRFRSNPSSNLIGINRPCILSTHGPGPAQLIIGNNCGFSGTVIGCFSEVRIGNEVMCGANTLITDSNWHLGDERAGKAEPVIIEDRVWLGVNVTVMKGVRIGKNAVIGANSLVTHDIPENAIAAGNPCKVIRIQDQNAS